MSFLVDLARPVCRAGVVAASVAAVFSCFVSRTVSASDWPQWRGSNRDGISLESGWKATWPEAGPKILWKINVGTGYSSVTVVGDHAFTMGNERVDKDTGVVFCLDVENGAVRWRHLFPSKLDPKYFDGGQLSTPTVDGEVVYVLGRQGQVFCLKRSTGAPIWSKDLVKELGGEMPTWGYSGSPLVLGEKLIVEGGGKGCSAVALNKTTGQLLWKAGDDIAGYGSPIVFEQAGRGVAFFNGVGLVIRQQDDGKEIARYPWKTQYDVNPTTPIIYGDQIFISSGYGRGCALLRFGSAGLSKVWESKVMRNKMNNCVLWKGCLFGFDESELACVDFATGDVKWKQKGLGMGALTLANGKLIVMTENGALAIVEPTPAGYKELAKAHVLDKTCWTSPTLANGRIFCRNNSGDMACVSVAGE